jgi:hypothetical protein
MVQVKRNEWIWVLLFALAVTAITTVPYVLGGLRSDGVWRFSGFVIGVEDGNSYLAKMQQGAHGQWLFRLPYAIEPHPPAFIFTFYLLLGKTVGALTGTGDPLRLHDALVAAYHLARAVLGIGLIAVVYRFLAELLPRIRQRRLALILSTLGGGLGWLLIVIPNLGQPLEFYSPESFSFLHLYSLPHLSLVRLLMLGGFLFYLRAVREHWAWAFAAGLSWLAMTLVQPFYMLIVLGVLALFVIVLMLLSFRQRESELVAGVDLGAAALRALWVSLLAGAFGIPMVLYTFLLFLVAPVYQVWAGQNIILSPPVWHYVSAWGLLLIAGLFGLRPLLRRNPVAWALVVAWVPLACLLVYAPYNLQRRFAEGVFVPLSGLAVLGLTVGIGSGRLRRSVQRYAPLVLIALSLPATALVWVGGLAVALRPGEPAFQNRDQVATYVFLARTLPPRAIVLSSYEFGNAVPAYGYLTAGLGHGPETPHLANKRDTAGQFYTRNASDLRSTHYEAFVYFGAPYVVFGPHEEALGGLQTSHTDFLQKIFESGTYSVWSLKTR